jgi:hypothetical protein
MIISREVRVSRNRRILRLLVPHGLGKEFEALAKELGKSKGELLRELMTAYRARRDEKEFVRVQRRITRQLKRPKPLTARMD